MKASITVVVGRGPRVDDCLSLNLSCPGHFVHLSFFLHQVDGINRLQEAIYFILLCVFLPTPTTNLHHYVQALVW